MDTDLQEKSREQLIAEVVRLRQGIRAHRDGTGHELCWHHPALWGLLPEQVDPQLAVPEWPQFMRGCIRYRQSLDEQAPGAPRTGEEFGDADEAQPAARRAIVLPAGEGRTYSMGGMSAIFKADEAETASRYSISEWWLAPDTAGPGAHAHPEDDVFHVLEGTMSFLVDGEWVDCPRGSFVLVPGGAAHDFQNRGNVRAGMLNISAPGGFEASMPMIVEWFEKHPPGRATG